MTATTPGAVVEPTTPILEGRSSDAALTERLLAPLWTDHPTLRRLQWISGVGAVIFLAAVVDTLITGIGLWGNEIPVAWGLGIVNMVWWIGIGHAGTFISAFLLLLDQEWRSAVNRLAETMTLFAVMIAGLFPVLHMGRAWFIYWLYPYPATMDVWPQFRSSLTFDAFAIPTYLIVSALFWYAGMIPDLASARDLAPTLHKRRVYGVLAVGWRGSARHWQQLRIALGLLAGLATPLVISVHTVISYDFSIAPLTGWHSTLLPPMFVIGALHSGFAMVIVLLVPLRRAWSLQDVVTERHLDALGKMLLMLAWLLGYCYFIEAFDAWMRPEVFERQLLLDLRWTGPYAFFAWSMITLNILLPQVLWSARVRRSGTAQLVVAVGVLTGMWLERFVIVCGSLSTDFLPSSWRMFTPTLVDAALFWGSVSTFFFGVITCLRSVPPIPVHELKHLRRVEGKE